MIPMIYLFEIRYLNGALNQRLRLDARKFEWKKIINYFMSSINMQKKTVISLYTIIYWGMLKKMSPKPIQKESPNKHTSCFKWGTVCQPQQNTMERKQMPFPINKISSRSHPNSICWSVMLVFSSFHGYSGKYKVAPPVACLLVYVTRMNSSDISKANFSGLLVCEGICPQKYSIL